MSMKRKTIFSDENLIAIASTASSKSVRLAAEVVLRQKHPTTRKVRSQVDKTEVNNNNLATRAQSEWSDYAGEPVTCEIIGGVLYAFGSELACLRLEHHMRCGRAKYSENLETWSYTTERA